MFSQPLPEARYPQLAKEALLTSEHKAHAENRVLAKLKTCQLFKYILDYQAWNSGPVIIVLLIFDFQLSSR